VTHQLLHQAAQLPRAAPVLCGLPAPESHEIQATQTSAKISDIRIPPGSGHKIMVSGKKNSSKHLPPARSYHDNCFMVTHEKQQHSRSTVI
jgi:hypothetical protein